MISWTDIVLGIWLGILTSISPCPLATNIAAISYLGRHINQNQRALCIFDPGDFTGIFNPYHSKIIAVSAKNYESNYRAGIIHCWAFSFKYHPFEYQ